MQQLSPEHLANWLSLYAATGLCAALCAFGAAFKLGIEVVGNREWQGLTDLRAAALFAPRLWWRWQKHYLTGTPVILAIVGYYATSLNW